MLPREFFIEDRLEKYRLNTACNLGESGVRNITLGELLEKIGIGFDSLKDISLADSSNIGNSDLREEIAALYPGVSPEEVLVTTGTGEALYILFRNFLRNGSLVSLLFPAFQALYELPLSMGAEIRKVAITSEYPVDELFSGNPDCIIINHPHNPTGTGLKESSIELLKTRACSFNGILLFDEHYRFLDYSKDLSFSGAGLTPKTFATGSITKCFGVTGLRIGWIIADRKVIPSLRSFKDYLTHTVNPISEFLALQILKNRKKLVTPIKNGIIQNIEYFKNSLTGISAIESFSVPDGGVVGFPKLKEGISSEKYSDELLKNCDVFILPGANFESEGFIRIGFGEEPQKFRAGIDRWVNWERRK